MPGDDHSANRVSSRDANELVGAFASMVMEVQEPSIIWPMMLAKLQEAVGFDAGYIAASWGSATEGRGAVAEHDEPFLKRNIGRYLAEIRPEEVAQYTDRARIHHDIWSRERQRELAVFREILDPTGMKHMIVRVSVRHGNVAGFNLERRDVAAPFSERELALVDMVAPFLHIVEVLTLRSQDDAGLDDLTLQHHLTNREREFVALAARGLQNPEIAMLLGISANTVRNTLAKVFEKVGVTNRAELAYLTARAGTDRQGKGSIVPPQPRLPEDGLRTFASRVQRASEQRLEPASSLDGQLAPRIVYTPPLTGV